MIQTPPLLNAPLLPTRWNQAIAAWLLLVGLGFGSLGCSESIDSRLAEAFELQESGELELAIISLQTILAEDPENEKTNFLLGTALVQSNHGKLAVPHLEKAAASELYGVPAGLLLASTQYRTEAYADAIDTCNRVLSIDPTNLTATFTSGQSHLALSQYEKALSQANHILDIRPGAQNAITMQTSALVGLDRSQEAETIWLNLRKQTANTSAGVRACTGLARFYQSQVKPTQADEIYTECLHEAPTDPYLLKAASDFFVRRSQPERAIAIHQFAANASPDDFQAWSRLAQTMYLHADPDATHRTYREITEKFDSPEAWRLLANFYRKTRHTTAARKAIEEALIRSERPPESFLYSLAELLVDEGNLTRATKIGRRLKKPSYRHILAGAISLASNRPQEAFEHLDKGLRSWPNNPNARYLMGQAALGVHDQARSIAAYRAAILVGSDTTDAALRLAEIYFANGEYKTARGFAKHQISRRPYLDPSPYHIAIRSALRLNLVDDANEILNSLRAIDPNAVAVIVELSAIRRVEGGAQASSDAIMASGRDLTDPINEPILRALASDLQSLGRGEEALVTIDLALTKDHAQEPETAALHDLRARVLSRLGRPQEALASMNRALAIDAHFAHSLEMKAHLAKEAGDLAAALAALDTASIAEPLESKYPYAAAKLAKEMNNSIGAISRLQATLARQPNHAAAANDLAWIFAVKRKNLDRALELAKIAVKKSPSEKTLLTLGWTHHQRGSFDKAIESYRTALRVNPDLPSIRYRLSLALVASGDIPAAREVLDELIRGAQFPELEAARTELARLQES